MKRKIIAALFIALALPFAFRCTGGFTLTKKLHGFTSSLGNKWLNWLAFLVLVIIPVYGICLLVDALVINSIEFWTGSNPVSQSDFDTHGNYTRSETKGNERNVYEYRKFGQELVVRTYKDDKLVKSLFMRKDEPGVLYAYDTGTPLRIEAITREVGDRVQVTILEGASIRDVQSFSRAEYSDLTGRAQAVAVKYAQASSF